MQPIGTYSAFVKAGNTVYISGQIPLDPATGELVSGPIKTHIVQAFTNLKAVVESAGASLQQVVKLTVYVTNLDHFDDVNHIMPQFFAEPFPARALIEVSRLPKDAPIEMDAIVVVAPA